MNLEELVSALENDANVNVIDTNSKKIKKTINDNLQRLQISGNMLKIYNKSLNSKLSEQDIKTLKETEKRFEEFIENEQASKIIREIKKRI